MPPAAAVRWRAANALAAGAIGAVFADDEDSFAAGIAGSAVIPVMMVTKTAGDTLRPAAQAGTLTISGTSANDFEQDLPALDDEVAGFSSRGIRIAGDVRPDVSAVGVSVFSAGMGTGTDGPGADYSVSPSQVTVTAGTSATVTLTLTIDPMQLTKTIDPTIDPAPDGLPGEFLADASGRVLHAAGPAGPAEAVRGPAPAR
jgi:hypothetical protein